jgi:hypothetical protein
LINKPRRYPNEPCKICLRSVLHVLFEVHGNDTSKASFDSQ